MAKEFQISDFGLQVDTTIERLLKSYLVNHKSYFQIVPRKS